MGVNIGYFSLLALALGARVVGFEPQGRAQPYLWMSGNLNPAMAERWQLFACAVGDAERECVA